MEYNTHVQYYKGVPIKLIVYTDKHFARLNAKRFILGDSKARQNIWIPNAYLEPNGTVKIGANIDFIFKKAYLQKKFYYAHIDHINPMLW
jgi:hypothetical protein